MAIQAEVLEAQVRVTGASAAKRDLGQIEAKAKATGKGVTSAGASMKRAFAGLALGGAAFSFLKSANAEARESQKVGAQTTAVLKSTGHAANITAKGIGNLANAISRKTGIDDEAIQSGENLLATFTNVRNGVGKSNQIFTKATKTLVDMGAALGGGPTSSAIQLGKALNNPTKGIAALTRVGVTFTEQQTDQIKALQKSGKTMAAQKIILRELKKEFGGSAAAQATAGDKATVAWKNLEEQIGLQFQPTLDKVLGKITNQAIPALSDFAKGLEDGHGKGGAFAKTFKADVVPALKDFVDLGHDLLPFLEGTTKLLHTALNAFEALPAPIRSNALLLGGMAIGFSKLGGSIGPTLGQMGTADGRGRALTSTYEKMGGALRNLAGAGGMLLLADAGNRTTKSMSALESAAGGALTGAGIGAFAGPEGAAIGAAIGGIGGAIIGLNRHLEDSGKSAANAKPQLDSYVDTIKAGTIALDGQTKAQIRNNLNKDGVFKAARNSGIDPGLVDKAAGGSGKALAAVNRELAASYIRLQSGLGGSTSDLAKISSALGLTGKSVQASIIKVNDLALTANKLKTVLPGLTHKSQIEVRTLGVKKAGEDIVRLTAKYHLTPKQITTVLNASGEKVTAKKIDGIIASAKKLKKSGKDAVVEPEVKGDKAARGLEGLLNNITHTTKRVKPSITPKVGQGNTAADLAGVIRRLQSIANNNPVHIKTTGGSALGGTIVKGMAFGGTVPGQRQPYGDKVLRMLAPGEEVISNANGQADRFRALRKAGLIPGMAKGGTVGREIGGVLGAAKSGLGPITRLLDRMEKSIRKNTSGARQKRLEKILKAQGAHLERVVAKRDKIAAQLTAAVAKRDDLRQQKTDFIGNVKEGIASQANVLNSGNNAGDIATNLATQAAKANEFAKLIQDLRSKGYSNAVIQQVAAAGIEGGLEVAKALAAGSSTDMASINASFGAITDVAEAQSKLLGDQFFNAGIESANGVIRGLKAQKKDIEKTLESIAKGMVKALRKALGINSPAKAFVAEMDHVGDGIKLGGKNQHPKVGMTGSALAGAVMGGFRSNRGNLTPAAMGRGMAGGAVHLTFVTHNPIAEPQSQTTNKALARVAAVGLV